MIHTVRIRGFKRFHEAHFRLPGHVVLAGPNNTGKTTVLQAVASWSLALQLWRRLGDFDLHATYAVRPRDLSTGEGIARLGDAGTSQEYKLAPIMRSAFLSVPLRTFNLLWTDHQERQPIEIEIGHHEGWSVTMELHYDTSEQILVRPKADVPADILRECNLQATFVPPMTGLGIEEPVYLPPKIEQFLGRGRPGEVLRNLLTDTYLVSEHEGTDAWGQIQASIRKIFNYELLPPDGGGADLLVEYRTENGSTLDIACAGNGFLQVLMLLVFLNTRDNSVLLLDGPDTHLHVTLQEAIYHELRTVAHRRRSQLVIATHSEVVINSVEPRELLHCS